MPLNYSVLKVVHVKSKQKLNCSVIFLAIKGGKDSQKEKSSEVNSKKLKNTCFIYYSLYNRKQKNFEITILRTLCKTPEASLING